ncbi:MAG: hypothetical protein V7K77_02490 [Nostoc sp.]|uniref:hypothetical protein n=1 Tax=Nostoc sp. TaxID=1180 RepID=UPI002FF510BB
MYYFIPDTIYAISITAKENSDNCIQLTSNPKNSYICDRLFNDLCWDSYLYSSLQLNEVQNQEFTNQIILLPPASCLVVEFRLRSTAA